jgi:hypothetical protein
LAKNLACQALRGVPATYAWDMSAEQEIQRVVDMAVHGRATDGDAFDKIDETALHALAGLKLLAVRLDALSKRIDELDEDTGSELADLRGEVKKLRKLVKKGHNS